MRNHDKLDFLLFSLLFPSFPYHFLNPLLSLLPSFILRSSYPTTAMDYEAIRQIIKDSRLGKDKDKPMPVSPLPFSLNTIADAIQPPFSRPFPTEILTLIIQQVDYETIPTCLRVSKHCFDVAGKILYAEIEIGHESDPEAMMMGAEIIESKAKGTGKEGDSKGAGNSEGKEIKKTNFKRQLLKHVRSIVVRSHECPRQKTGRMALTKAARMMTGLKRAILAPEADFMATHPLCQRISGCPLVAGLKCDSLTIHNIQVDGGDDGPLELFTTILNKVQHATLVIPPTAFYMEIRGGMAHLSGQPEDLSYATKHLKSVRLIVAISEMEMMMQGTDFPTTLTTIEPVQEFLAKFINLNDTPKIEIYLFNNFENTLDLVQFRSGLEAKVKKHYADSIKYLTDNNKLKPEYLNWSTDYKVFGLEEYFAIPTLHYELDDMMMEEWYFELHDRQKARYEEMKKARDEAIAEEGEVSNPGSLELTIADGQWSTDDEMEGIFDEENQGLKENGDQVAVAGEGEEEMKE